VTNMMMLDDITSVIASHRYRFTSEAELQRGIARVLDEAGIAFEREHHLAPGDIVDFLIGVIGVEVKVSGGPSEITRQLMRYAASPKVEGLILVTRKMQHARAIPDELAGKPVKTVTLERSAL